MTKRSSGLATMASLLLFAGATFAPNGASASDFSENYKKSVEAIVFIDVDNGKTGNLGTGFLVEDNLFITASHVVSDLKDSTIIKISGNDWPNVYITAKVVFRDERNDIAILKAEHQHEWDYFKKAEHPVNLGIALNHIDEGLEVYGIGNRAGHLFHTFVGNISATYEISTEASGIHWLDGEIMQGDSGGPMLNMNNEVVGMVDMFYNFGKESTDGVSDNMEAIITNLQLRKAIVNFKAGVTKSVDLDVGITEWTLDDIKNAEMPRLVLKKAAGSKVVNLLKMKVGDYNPTVEITGVFKKEIRNYEDWSEVMNMIAVGDNVTVTWHRGNDLITRSFKLNAR